MLAKGRLDGPRPQQIRPQSPRHASLAKMSDAEFDEAYRAAWVDLLHARTYPHDPAPRRGPQARARQRTTLNTVLWFTLMIRYEGVHPLEGGAFRLKFRRDRRSGMTRESIGLTFYPRYWGGMVVKATKYLKFFLGHAAHPQAGSRGARPLRLQRPRDRTAARGRVRGALDSTTPRAGARRRWPARSSATPFGRPPRRRPPQSQLRRLPPSNPAGSLTASRPRPGVRFRPPTRRAASAADPLPQAGEGSQMHLPPEPIGEGLRQRLAPGLAEPVPATPDRSGSENRSRSPAARVARARLSVATPLMMSGSAGPAAAEIDGVDAHAERRRARIARRHARRQGPGRVAPDRAAAAPRPRSDCRPAPASGVGVDLNGADANSRRGRLRRLPSARRRSADVLQALKPAAATAAKLGGCGARVHLAIDGFMLPPLSEFLTLRGLLHSRQRHSLPMTARDLFERLCLRRETLQE